MSATFNGQSDSNELGLHEPVGYEIVARSSAYPFPAHYCRMIRREVDPDFVPLWVNKLWRSPNGGDVWTGHHLLARHVRNPHSGATVIANLHLPSGKPYGFTYKTPLLEALLLDGLDDAARARGELARYEPFTGRHLQSMRYAMWARNNKRAEVRAREQAQIADAERERAQKFNDSEALYRRRHDDLRLRCVEGTASRVFVSETLQTLREAAGMEKVA